MNCPTCKGKGKQAIRVSEHGGKWRDMEIGCTTCDGQGEITQEQYEQLKRAQEAWCRCEKPSGETYHEDGERAICRKHHYTCNDCGKITQVG